MQCCTLVVNWSQLVVNVGFSPYLIFSLSILLVLVLVLVVVVVLLLLFETETLVSTVLLQFTPFFAVVSAVKWPVVELLCCILICG